MGKNQHYVPQFYLKLFSNDSKSIGTWNAKNDKIISNASISNMASRDYLYGSDQNLEEQLASWEKDWSVIIHRIIENNKIETVDEFMAILTFITIGNSRTLKSADANNYVNDYLAKLFLKNKISQEILNNVKIEMEVPNLMTMKVAAELTIILTDLEYVILENASSVSFITSDNPICSYNKFYVQRKYDRNYGWGSAGLIILLPLSPQKCFCLYDPMVYRTIPSNVIILKSGNDIIHINRLLTRNAYHNIFFNNQKNCCVDDIKKAHHKVPIESNVQSFGPFFKLGGDSILENFKLNFLKVRKKYEKIPLPPHMAGLMRPLAEQYKDENRDKYYETSQFNL